MTLTKGQLEVVRLLIAGARHADIPDKLGITPGAMHERLNQARIRLGCATMFEFAFRLGLEAREALEKEV